MLCYAPCVATAAADAAIAQTRKPVLYCELALLLLLAYAVVALLLQLALLLQELAYALVVALSYTKVLEHFPQYTRSTWVAMKVPGPHDGHCLRRRWTLPESSTWGRESGLCCLEG